MRVLLKYLKKRERVFFVTCALFGLLQSWFNLRIPDYMKSITTMLNTGNRDMTALQHAGLRMLICAALSFGAAVIMAYLSARMGAGISKGLREDVFKKTMSFSLEEMGRFSTGSLITRCTNDITRIQSTFCSAPPVLLQAPLTAIVAIARMGTSHKFWMVDTAVMVVLMTVSIQFFIRKMRPHVVKRQYKTDDLNRVTREHLIGLKPIHAFASYEYQAQKANKINKELGDALQKGRAYYALINPLLTALMNILNLSIYLIGVKLIMTAGADDKIVLFSEMVMFSSYAALVVSAFTQLIVVYSSIGDTAASVNRVKEVLLSEPSITDGPGVSSFPEPGVVEFKHVNFRYNEDGGLVLKDLNFRIEKGQTVAIIGATGCGKTSVLNLIPRMYDVSEGEVLVGGRNVRDYKLKELRGVIGYVPQRSVLFSGTIADNINYGDNGRFNATLKEIKKASEVGQAREFIEQKEGGYDAHVARDGSNFSGGQKQRLSISRAICRDPEIYLFDDSFSALDFQTDKRLRQALKETAAGATVIIVAQRIGTIRGADQIIVMDEGAIVGIGKHEELLKNCRVYQEIAKSQLSEKEVAEFEALA